MYQFQTAPVPKLPPEMLNVVLEPLHTADGEAVIEEGSVDNKFTLIILETHAIVLHVPSALTQYVIVTVGVKTGVNPEMT